MLCKTIKRHEMNSRLCTDIRENDKMVLSGVITIFTKKKVKTFMKLPTLYAHRRELPYLQRQKSYLVETIVYIITVIIYETHAIFFL